MIGDFHFLRPWWWFALIALPALWYALRRGDAQWRAWSRVVDPHLLPHLVAGAEPARRWPLVLAFAAWIVGVAAVAGPAWERLPMPVQRNQAAHVIAFELAPSMLAGDLKPDRLTRARYKVRDLLGRLRDGQVALIGYAGDAFVVAPLTDDGKTVENLLDGLDPTVMPVGGNATGVAIRRGVALIEQSGERGGDLILVADAVSDDAVQAAREAASHGVRVSVLGIGTAQGAPVSLPQGDFLKDAQGNIVIPKLDASALAAVAHAGGGRYVDGAGDPASLDALIGERARVVAGGTGVGATTQEWRDRGPWLALLLLPLALAGFRRGWLMAVVLVACLGAQRPALAFGFADLWQRPDQQAWQQLQDGKAKEAQSLAQDPALRGASAFRAGDYAAAQNDYSALGDGEAAYNRGNSLAAQQKWQDAIKAWDEAIERSPEHADAAANKSAVEAWLKQQQQNQQQPQQDKDGKSGQGGQGQAGDGQQQQQGDKKQDQQSDPQSQDQQSSPDGKSSDSDTGKGGKDSRGGSKPEGEGEKNDEQRRGEAGAEKDKQQAAQQQEAFRKAMDKAVEQTKGQQPEGKDGAKARAESDTQREQRQAVDQWLERVPDDPGGLLRRKFQLEYERRQREAAQGERR